MRKDVGLNEQSKRSADFVRQAEEESEVLLSYDPYDLWSTQYGVAVRRAFYNGQLLAKLSAAGVMLLDWLLSIPIRRLTRVQRRLYPIVVAQETLRSELDGTLDDQLAQYFLQQLRETAVVAPEKRGVSWGLGFPWMSKNGLYSSDTAFVTHTPYALEALLVLSTRAQTNEEAITLFRDSWRFLESLHEMYRDQNELALSYAPLPEPRIVVNANAYAAYAYALHALYGADEVREIARSKVGRIVRWVINRQKDDGSWYYYDDRQSGNFIDCFHSCFVVKNLIKTMSLIPELEGMIKPSVVSGWSFIRNTFPERGNGLCRRFVRRGIRDPFKFDLYDQAEYLGLLIDFGHLQEGLEFSRLVERRFHVRGHWYCRLDYLGRRWGRDFLRWGIVPFQYQMARMRER